MTKLWFILLLFISVSSYGQKWTLTELIKLSKSDDDYFDTYVTSKGYKFLKTEHIVSTKCSIVIIIYAFNQDGISEKALYSLQKWNYTSGLCKIHYNMGFSKVEYLSLKSQMKIEGFKFIKSDDLDGELRMTYKKGNLTVTLLSFQAENGLSEKVTAYGARL